MKGCQCYRWGDVYLLVQCPPITSEAAAAAATATPAQLSATVGSQCDIAWRGEGWRDAWHVTRDTWQPRHGPELGDDDLGAAPLPGGQLQVGHHRDIRCHYYTSNSMQAASCRLCSLNIKQKNTRYTRYRFGPLQVLIPGTDKRWRLSTRAVILPACSTAQMEGEAEDNYNHEPWTYLNIYIYILNFISFQICFERGELQPDGCCQLSDDPQRIQDDGQPSTEKPSQCSQ